MPATLDTLLVEIRAIPLNERIETAIKMIGAMCAEGRGPHMSVPVRAKDEDMFIVATLRDAGQSLLSAEEMYKLGWLAAMNEAARLTMQFVATNQSPPSLSIASPAQTTD